MIFNPKNKIIYIAAVITLLAFIWQDVVWAAGSDFVQSRSHLRGEQLAEAEARPKTDARSIGEGGRIVAVPDALRSTIQDYVGPFLKASRPVVIFYDLDNTVAFDSDQKITDTVADSIKRLLDVPVQNKIYVVILTNRSMGVIKRRFTEPMGTEIEPGTIRTKKYPNLYCLPDCGLDVLKSDFTEGELQDKLDTWSDKIGDVLDRARVGIDRVLVVERKDDFLNLDRKHNYLIARRGVGVTLGLYRTIFGSLKDDAARLQFRKDLRLKLMEGGVEHCFIGGKASLDALLFDKYQAADRIVQMVAEENGVLPGQVGEVAVDDEFKHGFGGRRLIEFVREHGGIGISPAKNGVVRVEAQEAPEGAIIMPQSGPFVTLLVDGAIIRAARVARAAAAGNSKGELTAGAAATGKTAKVFYRYRWHATLTALGGAAIALISVFHNDLPFITKLIEPYSAYIPLVAGVVGLLSFTALAVIGSIRAKNEKLVNNLLNAMKGGEENEDEVAVEYERPVISGYYSYQRLDQKTFQRRIMGFFGLSTQEHLLSTLEDKLVEANDDNKFYVLYRNNNEHGGPKIEVIVNIKINDGIWYISFECVDGVGSSMYLSEDFIREEIAKKNPSVIIFQKGCVDERALSKPLRNHIPMFHVAKRDALRDRAFRAFRIDIKDDKDESEFLVYEFSRFTLLDKVTLWIAAQKFSRKYKVGVWHFTLGASLSSITGGLMWNEMMKYAGSPKIDVLSKYNFALAYLMPLVIVTCYPPIGEWVAKKVRERLDRRTVDMAKDKQTGRIKEKWNAKVADHRVVSSIIRCMWLKPITFPIYRILYVALFPWAILGSAFGSHLLPQITSPAAYLTMLFVWWLFINITSPIIGQTWGEAVVGEMQNSEAAKSEGFAAVYPVISSFSDFIWINIIQLSSFAIGHGTMGLMLIGAIPLHLFMPLLIGLTIVTFINEFSLPLLAHDYNAYLEIDDCVAPMTITDTKKGASRLTYVENSDGPEVWLDVTPIDDELFGIKPIRINNESYLPWLENTMQASIHSRNGFKINSGRAGRLAASSITFRASDNGPVFTLRKRWGKIIEGRDYVIHTGTDGVHEVILYPKTSQEQPVTASASGSPVVAKSTGDTVELWTNELCEDCRNNTAIFDDPQFSARICAVLSVMNEEDRFKVIGNVFKKMHQEKKITAEAAKRFVDLTNIYGIITVDHVAALTAMIQEFNDMDHLLDIVHDILNYFTPINGYILFGFNESAYSQQEREVYQRLLYLNDEREKWADKQPTQIDFYRLRSSEPENYKAIIEAGRKYIAELRDALTALDASTFMYEDRLKFLVEDADLGGQNPEETTNEIKSAFRHEVDYGINLLNSYLSEEEASQTINVVSEINAITRIFAMENARASDHQVPKINFAVEIEGDEGEVSQACVNMKPTAFQDAVRNPLKNAVFNMPQQEGAFIKVKISVAAGVAIIRVMDNAGGIPVERNGVKIRENILKAYVTTKETKQESAIKGRGLTITKQHVEGAGGKISLEDTVTQEELTAEEITKRQQLGLMDYPGSIVRLELPVAAAATGRKIINTPGRIAAIQFALRTAATAMVVSAEISRRSRRILIVDISETNADIIAKELSARWHFPAANIYTIGIQPGENLEMALLHKYGIVPVIDRVFSNAVVNKGFMLEIPAFEGKFGLEYPNLNDVRKAARRIAEFL